MSKKAFFFDIDGTLAIDGKTPESALESLKLLKEKGYYTFICSGRAPVYVKKLYRGLVSGYVCCNGRYTILDEKKLDGVEIPKEQLHRIMKKLDDLGCDYFVISDQKIYVTHIPERFEHYMFGDYGKENLIYEFDESLPYYCIDLFYKDRDHIAKIIEEMKDELIINDHFGGSADCTTVNYDKGNGVAHVLDLLGISKEDAYGFGDGSNDIPMFREVGNRIAMANGIDALKEKASYVTDSVNEDGIYNALKKYELI